MRTAGRSILILATIATLGAVEARGQAHVSFSVGGGPLFAGVGFGIGGGHHNVGSLFVGASFGMAHYSAVGGYGIYSGPSYYDGGSCWDYYWETYYDPYNDWFYDCAVRGPYRYSYRATNWAHRWSGWYGRSSFAHLYNPYYDPWDPYWAYDPWGSYWAGGHYGIGYYGLGHRGGYYGSYYYSGTVV